LSFYFDIANWCKIVTVFVWHNSRPKWIKSVDGCFSKCFVRSVWACGCCVIHYPSYPGFATILYLIVSFIPDVLVVNNTIIINYLTCYFLFIPDVLVVNNTTVINYHTCYIFFSNISFQQQNFWAEWQHMSYFCIWKTYR